MSDYKTDSFLGGGKAGNGAIIFGVAVISLIIVLILALLGVFGDTSGSIYKIKIKGEPGKAIQIARMFITDANGKKVALTTDGDNYYDKSQVWGHLKPGLWDQDKSESSLPSNIIAQYDDNSTCGDNEHELHTTEANRGVWLTMMNDDHTDPRIRMKKGDVNYADFKTAEEVNLEGSKVTVLGRYHCGKKWTEAGEAFTITVTNVNTGAEATVFVPKLRYGVNIQHSEALVFV